LVTFSPETPEFMLLTIAPFAVIRQKSAYYAKYLRMSRTYLDLLYRFVRRIGGNDYPDIRLAVAQGTLLWQPVKFGRCSQTSPGTTFCSLLWRLTTHWPIVNPLSKDEIEIFQLYIMYKFGELPSNNLRVYVVKTRNFCRNSPATAILRRSSFITLAFQNDFCQIQVPSYANEPSYLWSYPAEVHKICTRCSHIIFAVNAHI